MNYDKLVKQLRAENTLPYSALKLMREAADAIELSESLVSVYKDALCSCMQKQKESERISKMADDDLLTLQWMKAKTNADVIRAMSDEELAKFLQEDVFYEPWCPDDVVCLFGDGCQLTDKDCGKCALKWIKQEYKNGQIHKA